MFTEISKVNVDQNRSKDYRFIIYQFEFSGHSLKYHLKASLHCSLFLDMTKAWLVVSLTPFNLFKECYS